jgi:hypothetical protein
VNAIQIRLFGDPRSAGSETPTLDIVLTAEFIPSVDDIVHEPSLNVVCDFIDGYAFGEAIGVGIRSIAGWWTVMSVELVHPIDVGAYNLCLICTD